MIGILISFYFVCNASSCQLDNSSMQPCAIKMVNMVSVQLLAS